METFTEREKTFAEVSDVHGNVILQLHGKEVLYSAVSTFLYEMVRCSLHRPVITFITALAMSFITGGVNGSSDYIYCKRYTREENFMLTKTKMQEIQD